MGDKNLFVSDRIKDPKLLKVGDRIRVLKRPKMWASLLSDKKPFPKYPEEVFPLDLTIVEMKWDQDDSEPGDSYMAMKCEEEYGWDLTSIVKAGCELISREGW